MTDAEKRLEKWETLRTVYGRECCPIRIQDFFDGLGRLVELEQREVQREKIAESFKRAEDKMRAEAWAEYPKQPEPAVELSEEIAQRAIELERHLRDPGDFYRVAFATLFGNFARAILEQARREKG